MLLLNGFYYVKIKYTKIYKNIYNSYLEDILCENYILQKLLNVKLGTNLSSF